MRDIVNYIDIFTEKEISYTQANEAYISSLMTIKNKKDVFYFLSSMNLLNSYVKKTMHRGILIKNINLRTTY